MAQACDTPPAAIARKRRPISARARRASACRGPALKAFFNIAARWKVRDEDARALLGGVTNGPFYEMKRNPDRVVDTDRLTRISYLIGIFKALQHPPPRKPRRRVGAPAEQQSDFRRRGAAGLHDPRRAARHADRAAPARRAPRRMMALPPVTLVRQFDTHRLILSRHLPQGDSVLVAIADNDAHLQAIFELDAATNDRLLAGQQLLPGNRSRGARVRACRMPASSTPRSVIRIRSAAASTGRIAARGTPPSISKRRRRRSASTNRFSSPRLAASRTR